MRKPSTFVRVLGIALASLLAAGTTALAQAAPAADLPRTPDGHPDFSGTYGVATLTPLTRPQQFGDKQFLTNFNDNPGMFMASDALHVVEKFTRLDATTLLYEFTVDDSKTWSKPWSGQYPWPASENRVFEYACHEGNYALGNIMRGARALEQEAIAARGTSAGKDAPKRDAGE